MRTGKQIREVADMLYAKVALDLDNLAESKAPVVEGLSEKPIEEGVKTLQSIISSVQAIISIQRVEDLKLPEFLSKFSYPKDATFLKDFRLTIRSKLKSEIKFSDETKITVDKDVVENISRFYVENLFDMYYLERANENIAELNVKLADICEESGVPFRFSFAIDTNTKAQVLEIDNDHVVFNADVGCMHNLDSNPLFSTGDIYADSICEEATKDLIMQLAPIQTTVQLVKAQLDLVLQLTGTKHSKRRVNSVLRQTYHRNAKHLGRLKEGVGYFDEKVSIDGESVSIFALVRKGEDGELSIALSPFNVRDLFLVDYDVISAVREQIEAQAV